jgi:methyltransferase
MTSGTFLFLTFIVVQRLAELFIARRNTARLMARGAHEVGAGHYPLHIGWLALYAVLQVFRVWILGTLGERWTTRIIVLDEQLVVRGPFRFIPHPNYTLVVLEIIVAPMVMGLTWFAAVFTVLNAMMLYHRIGVEDGALRGKGRHATGHVRR